MRRSMEQYWNLIWKNYTASLSPNSNDDDLIGGPDDSSDTFANGDLHYKIPFWIGVIVISLLFISALIASIRYCLHSLCSSHAEAEKLALVTPRSPCLKSSTTHTIQRQQTRPLPHTLPRPSTNEKKALHVSSNNESRDEHCRTSIVPIHRQQSRPPCISTHTLPRRHHLNEIDTEDSYFPPMQTPPRRQNSNDFRKKIHGIYVLPVSPALSSSSSTTTNTDEMNKASTSNTMPIRSIRHISSSIQMQKDTNSPRGIKNDCFADSPQTKDRTLPRSHAGTLRRVQPPVQPPPLPPPLAQFQMNHQQTFLSHHDDQTTFSHQSTRLELDPDVIALRLSSQKIYGTKAPPPPVPCRTQKPTLMPIGFESFNASSQSGAPPLPPPPPPPPLDMIGFQSLIESSTQDDFVDHSWPKPPESMTTSEIGGPPPVLPPSIPYDRLNHDHLIPTVLMRQNQTNTFFQHHRFDGPNLFSESET